MKEKIRSWLRPSGKKTDIIIVALILTTVMVFAGDLLGYYSTMVIPFKAAVALLTPNEDINEFASLYYEFIGIWVFFFLFCIVKYNRPIMAKLAINKKALKGMLIGALLGFGTNGICILGAAIMGDIKLSFSEINPGLIIFFIIVVCIQSGAEELCDRIYLYQKMRRRFKSPAVAFIVNCLFFASMHAFNPGVTFFSLFSIFVVAILYTFLIYYYDNAWMAIMTHAFWNYTQNIVFGLPNSGIVSQYSVFKLEAASARDGFFYSAAFGVEGSYAAVLVNIICIVVIILLNRGKGEKNDTWAEMA